VTRDLSYRSKSRNDIFGHFWFGVFLQLFDFTFCVLDAAFGVVDGDGEVVGLGLAALELNHATGVAFEAFGVGVICSGFESGVIAVFGCGCIFLEGEAGHLFEWKVEL